MLNVGPLLVEDAAAEPNGPVRIGVDRPIPGGADTASHGTWSQAGGRHLWRLRLRDPGARALRLKLERFAGGQLIVCDPAQAFAWELGPDDVQVDGTLWTPPIPGEEILLEYRTARRPARPPLRIEAVSHLYAGGYASGYQGYNGCVVESCHLDTACNSPCPTSCATGWAR